MNINPKHKYQAEKAVEVAAGITAVTLGAVMVYYALRITSLILQYIGVPAVVADTLLMIGSASIIYRTAMGTPQKPEPDLDEEFTKAQTHAFRPVKVD